MTNEMKMQRVRETMKKSWALSHAASVLNYDGETVAPDQSGEGRAQTFGVLGDIQYSLITDSELMQTLDELDSAKAELSEYDTRELALIRRHVRQTAVVPKEEYVRHVMLESEASDVWRRAKNTNDFASFAPYLEKLIDYNRRYAAWLEPDKDAYDTLLDLYEEGMDQKTLDVFFETLRTGLKPLVDKVAAAGQPEDAFLHQCYPIADQRRFTEELARLEGLDRSRLAIGEVEHPFTDAFNNKDVRITTHYHENDPMSSAFSVLHEGGHAIYELGMDDRFNYSVFAGGASLGIHESQSRFYENIIGRSYAFSKPLLEAMKKIFPQQLDGVGRDEFWHAVNRSQPSLIRTEADELTYCFHVMVRYELEKRLINGTLAVADVPAAWGDLYEEYLGVRPATDTEGCLQDSHWSSGAFGYFPTYALGSAYGAQMLRAMERDVPDLWQRVEKGDLSPVTEYLGERIHRHSAYYPPKELFERSFGKFDPQYFIDYLTDKYTKLYSL